MPSTNPQTPFASILSCSDSRVPPESLFDQGLGDLFVARIAGNTASGRLIDSLLYGTDVLGTKLLFVLGHSLAGRWRQPSVTIRMNLTQSCRL